MKNHISLSTQMNVAKFLETVLEKTETGCRYKSNYDDTTVARTLSKTHEVEITKNNVVNVRRELFGDITREAQKTTCDARLKELEARVQKLEEFFK